MGIHNDTGMLTSAAAHARTRTQGMLYCYSQQRYQGPRVYMNWLPLMITVAEITPTRNQLKIDTLREDISP